MQQKLQHRRQYLRYLTTLQTYLTGFLERTVPTIDVEGQVAAPVLTQLTNYWTDANNLNTSWANCWTIEAADVKDAQRRSATDSGHDHDDGWEDLSHHASPPALLEAMGADGVKAALVTRGMKCGGRPADRAARLFLVRDHADAAALRAFAAALPAKKCSKLFVRGAAADGAPPSSAPPGAAAVSKYVLARAEASAAAALRQLRSALDATVLRSERSSTQTAAERQREWTEEAEDGDNHRGPGAEGVVRGDSDSEGTDDDASDDDDEAPIYNPKGMPLGWDGKPIPYWLCKLHGLNHFFTCEICGNERYRGRRNFERHFAEAKHAYGMGCLGMPDTKHFHGVTQIEDAQRLWESLRTTVDHDQFDNAKEEEYEDSHGNVLNRATYEDLARQGLL